VEERFSLTTPLSLQLPMCEKESSVCRKRTIILLGTERKTNIKDLCHCPEGLICHNTPEVERDFNQIDELFRCCR
jgi:hypothetical protein